MNVEKMFLAAKRVFPRDLLGGFRTQYHPRTGMYEIYAWHTYYGRACEHPLGHTRDQGAAREACRKLRDLLAATKALTS